MKALRAIADFLAAVLLAPVLLAISTAALLACDLWWYLAGRSRPPANKMPRTTAVSVVIPNWNGRDLLEKYLPSVVDALAHYPESEIIVVDNASSDDSVEFMRTRFPQVTVLALPVNLGFGGGSNAGFGAARNDIVVLLNSDMRVESDFLAPLLDGFTSDDVFAVSCQIFLSDPTKRREETGLTAGWWEDGKLRVTHHDEPSVDQPFPCFYAGGGSSAFDRAKFLELGGFDELLAPFYLEDTDLGFLAWKRGWKVLYQPASVVYHEHRGTIGRKFSPAFIDSILKKNYLLFAWKNIHGWPWLLASLFSAWAGSIASAVGGDRPLRANLAGIWRAFRQLPGAMASRTAARSLQLVDEREAFARSRGSHFRDRFLPLATASERLRVLFVSPYPILPPAHGGAVFMLQTVRELAKTSDVHALVLLDDPSEAEANAHLAATCASVDLMVRPRNPSLLSFTPHAVEEFHSRAVQWAIDRLVFLHRIDVIQMEYTAMGQYLEPFHRIATALFEHDVYFQSVARTARFLASPLARAKAHFEYLRALKYELALLPRCDLVQVCTPQNRDYLLSFNPQLASRVHMGMRAAVDAGSYAYPGGPRELHSLLFIGSSRHKPNLLAIEWFVAEVLPRVVAAYPGVRLYLAGFDARLHPEFAMNSHIEMLGYVEDVQPWLGRCAVFVCPVLSGSGVRVKLLEAFASGIPVVSTRIGAEGLATSDGDICALADTPAAFASKTLELLEGTCSVNAMTARARTEIETNWDSGVVGRRLLQSYRDVLSSKRRPRLV